MIEPLSPLRRLDVEIERAMLGDRHRLRKMLRAVEQAARQGKPFDEALDRLRQRLLESIHRRALRQEGVPRVRYDTSLPIAERRDEIARAITEHQVVVVSGETGSGKSTQLPKICLELGRGVAGLIGHTQPRRIAARSIAARIAEELSSPLGSAVGYKVRFTDSTSPQTYIKLMTDGVLLAESQHDRFLEQYDTIILDEAHERSLNIDFLLGYLKRLLPRRPELKVIVTSATIDAARFAAHFEPAAGPVPVIEVSGRTYPVEVRYRPLAEDEDLEPDVIGGVVEAVEELARIDSGDILVFMPTEHDIHEAAKALRGRMLPGGNTSVLPLYARLSAAEQNKIFQPHTGRRIVIATNVAESSLTVPGIRYVVDPGTARISRYAARSKVERLPIEPISQASADQRKGRCGRLGPGICIRLYSEEDYLARDRYTSPEIQRSNLASVILQAKALGFGDLEQFPFLDPPRPDAVRDGYQTLFELGALDERQELTDLGRKLSRLPVDPRIGRMILAASEEDCLQEVLIIAAALEVHDPRERPRDKQQAADDSHARWAHEESDFLSYLQLWDEYQRWRRQLSRSQLRKACQQNFLSYNRMREWLDVHRQLRELVERAGLAPRPRRDDYDAIHRALLAGLLSNVAYRSGPREYTSAGGSKGFLWPGSGALETKPKWVVASEVIETNRRYLRTVARINPKWIEPLAGHLVERTYSEPHWDFRRAVPMVYEKVTLFGLTVIHGRRVPLGPVDPRRARELFIQRGLVEDGYATRAPFAQHNHKLVEELQELETRLRRRDLLLGEEARYDFYDARIPSHVWDGPRFERWRRYAERQEPLLLHMKESDLLRHEAGRAETGNFPDTVAVEQMELPLDYRFEPGTEADGVTLIVPKEGLNQLDPERLGWLVPGLLEEKVIALIKSLPKALRRNFVPVPDTARQIVAGLRFGEGSLAGAVAAALSKLCGEPIPTSAFRHEELPDYLRMNVRVIDAEGKPVAHSRDLLALREELGGRNGETPAPADHPDWNRDGLLTWDFDELPRQLTIARGGIVLPVFPALVDAGRAVDLRLLDSPTRADRTTRAGVRRLYCLAAGRELKAQVDWLPGLDELVLLASGMADARTFQDALAELIADRAFLGDRPLPRRREEFEAGLRWGRPRIAMAVQEVLALVVPLVKAYHHARLEVEDARAPSWQYAVADIREQLHELTQPGFLTATPWQWLEQYPRYLEAIVYRLQKLTGDGLARDRRHSEQFLPRWQAYLEQAARQRDYGLDDPELEQYRWMLEEYRVSLFAQKLGTLLPVSEKRLDEQRARCRS